MLQKTWRSQGWSESRVERSIDALIAQSVHTYLYPLETLAKHPDTKWTVVDYRDLVARPKATVEAVYETLDIAMTPAVSSALDAQQQRARAHQSLHSYGLEEFGIDEARLKQDLHELFDRFGWDAPPNVPEPLEKRSEHG
jgi:molybdopterin-biosynthesis enzyme MoeA-like protein